MEIFGQHFLDTVHRSITETVENAVKTYVSHLENNERYLKQKEAMEYLGGMTNQDFKQLHLIGLKQIVIKRPNGSKCVRWDKRDLDAFMASYKV